MYIGVGWLFCVTLPDEIRYGIGVRMCAPSIPLPSEPSTRLSRVVPHEACFCTSTSGMPYLAKMPFSLATNSGAASVNAMNPSLAAVTSGPAPCAEAPAWGRIGNLRQGRWCPLRLDGRPFGVTARRIGARSRDAPVRRFHNSDEWSQGTASMASAQAIQASCQAEKSKKDQHLQNVERIVLENVQPVPHSKFAIRTILVRRTIVVQST